MPLYELKCPDGHRAEVNLSFYDEIPPCQRCGSPMIRVTTTFAIKGKATLPSPPENMPQTWRGTYGGNREYLTQLRREAEARQNLEERHPELAGDRRPVLAHEGRFESKPLRAGDSLGSTPNHAGHAHGDGSAHNHHHDNTHP